MADGQDERGRSAPPEAPDNGHRGRTVRISFRLAALICLASLAGLTWALTILSAPSEPPASRPVRTAAAPDPSPGPGSAPGPNNLSARIAQARLYEEPARDGLAEAARLIDLAILETIKAVGQDLSSVSILEIRTLYSGRESYLQQTLAIRLDGKRELFIDQLAVFLAKAAPGATLREDRDRVGIVVHGQLTHSLVLRHQPEFDQSPLPHPSPVKTARLAIVIDDLGESLDFATNLSKLGIPVAFAVWPSSTNSKRIAVLAHKAHMEVLLHQPMEPRSYPEDDPGRGAVFVAMDEATIRKTVVENLAHFPMAVGINNHMGSRFTEDSRGMRIVLEELRGHGLFYLDSMTTAKSVGTAVGRKIGIPVLRRDVFLDNVADVDAILLQLRKAENVALKNGQAVAIGHPYPETLQALRTWIAQRDTRVEAVTLNSLLHPAAQPSTEAVPDRIRKALPEATVPHLKPATPRVRTEPSPVPQPDTQTGEPSGRPSSEPRPIEITPLP